jgi:hypothetical protein
VWPERVGKLKRGIDLMRSRTRDLPPCSIVPQPLPYGCLLSSIDKTILDERYPVQESSFCCAKDIIFGIKQVLQSTAYAFFA